MEMVGLGAKNENPSRPDIRTAASSDSRRPRLCRDVFGTECGGKVGGVQASQSPGFPTQFVCVQSHRFVEKTFLSLGDHLMDIYASFLPQGAAASPPTSLDVINRSRPIYSQFIMTNNRGSQTIYSSKKTQENREGKA